MNTELQDFAQPDTGDNWRSEVAIKFAEPLQIEDRQSARFVWLSNGEKFEHPTYKPAIVFLIKVHDENAIRKLYVRSQRLLRQIYALGNDIVGIECQLRRRGKGIETEWELTNLSAQQDENESA